MATFNWDAPLMDEENAHWLQTMSWGGLPKDGHEFMEEAGWYKLSRSEQRTAVEEFMAGPRARHIPDAVRQHFIDLGLID